MFLFFHYFVIFLIFGLFTFVLSSKGREAPRCPPRVPGTLHTHPNPSDPKKISNMSKISGKNIKASRTLLKSDSPLGTNGCWLSQVGQKCVVNGVKFG